MFYWLQDHVKQGNFQIFWTLDKVNLADNFKKYHYLAHHKKLRPIYAYIEGQSPTSL